jgi:hypothetical protein
MTAREFNKGGSVSAGGRIVIHTLPCLWINLWISVRK